MTTLALPQCPAGCFHWPRVAALCGTFALHLGAITLLLIPPVAVHLLQRRAADDPIVVTIIEPMPKAAEVPAPKPQPLVREVRRKAAPKPVAAAPVPPPVAESPLPSQLADPTPTVAATPAPPADSTPTPWRTSRARAFRIRARHCSGASTAP